MNHEEILIKFEKNKGNEEFKNKNYNKAIEHYSKSIKIKKNAICYSNRSACYFHLGEYDLGLKDGLESIKLDEKYQKGYYRVGVIIIFILKFRQFLFKNKNF
jgi:tetratricopeptide (TPR) repeat protein